jgi:prepilin-type processing-associated H-X9-DG protein
MKNRASEGAFTAAELVATVAVLIVCGVISLSAIGADSRGAKGVVCMNNFKQLTTAWLMYANANGGRLVENYTGGLAQGGAAANQGKSPWASGWLDWTAATDNTNANFLYVEKYAKLAPYFLEPDIEKCPEDNYLSAVQKARRFPARNRSVSLNGPLGDGNFESGPTDPTYKHIRKISEVWQPTPAETAVFLDEHASSINDPLIYPPLQSGWIDLPAAYHENGSTVSFADGHVEVHSWKSSARAQNAPVTLQDGGFHLRTPSKLGDVDISWFSFHSPRASDKHY